MTPAVNVTGLSHAQLQLALRLAALEADTDATAASHPGGQAEVRLPRDGAERLLHVLHALACRPRQDRDTLRALQGKLDAALERADRLQ